MYAVAKIHIFLENCSDLLEKLNFLCFLVEKHIFLMIQFVFTIP